MSSLVGERWCSPRVYILHVNQWTQYTMLGGHEKTCLHSIVWFEDNKYALDEVINVDMCVTR